MPVNPDQPCGVVAAQLNSLGFGDVRASKDGAELISEVLHIAWWRRSRALCLPDLKKLYADAAVEGKKLIVLTEYDLTGPAEKFADRSRSFAFWFDPHRGHVSGGNQLTQERMFAEV